MNFGLFPDNESLNVVDSFDTISGFLGCKCCAKVNIRRATGRYKNAQPSKDEESNYSGKCYLIKTSAPSRLPYIVHMFPSNIKFHLDTIYTSTFDQKNRSIELTFQEGRSALKLEFFFPHDFFLFQKYIELKEEDGDEQRLIYVRSARLSGAVNTSGVTQTTQKKTRKSLSRSGSIPGQKKKKNSSKLFGSIDLSAQELGNQRKCGEWRITDYRTWLKRIPIQIVYGNASKLEEENDIVISNLFDVLKRYGVISQLEKFLSDSTMIQFRDELRGIDRNPHRLRRLRERHFQHDDVSDDIDPEKEQSKESEEENEENEMKNSSHHQKKKKLSESKVKKIAMNPQLEEFFAKHQVVRRHLLFHMEIAEDSGWLFNNAYYMVLDKVVRFLQKKKGFKNRQKLEEIETGLFYHRRSLWDPLRLRQRILVMLLYNTSVENVIEKFSDSFHQYETEFRERIEAEYHNHMTIQFEEERRKNLQKKDQKEEEEEESGEDEEFDDDDDDDSEFGRKRDSLDEISTFQKNTPISKYKFTPEDYDRILHGFNVQERLRIDQLSYTVNLQTERNELWKKKIELSEKRRTARQKLNKRVKQNQGISKKIEELESQRTRILKQSQENKSPIFQQLLDRVIGQISQREAEWVEGRAFEVNLRDGLEEMTEDLMTQKRLLRDCVSRRRPMGELRFLASSEHQEQIERLIQNRIEFLRTQQLHMISKKRINHSSSSSMNNESTSSIGNIIIPESSSDEYEGNPSQNKTTSENKDKFRNFEFQVKLVLAKHAASPPQFIRELVKKFVDPFFSPKYLSFGFIHSYILIKNLQIHFFDNSLVYVNDFKNSPVSSYQNIVCLDTDFPIVCDFDTLRKKIDSLAEMIIRWNTEIEYASFRVWGMNDKRNCQEFVLEMLDVLGTPPFYPSVNKYLSSLRKRLEEGFHKDTDLRFITVDSSFLREFHTAIQYLMEDDAKKKSESSKSQTKNDSNNFHSQTQKKEEENEGEEEEESEKSEKSDSLRFKNQIFFRTHEQVDNFVHRCRKTDHDFDFNYPGIITLLKGFDRAFWMSKRQFSSSNKDSPSDPRCEPSKAGCPFVSRKRKRIDQSFE